MIISRIAHSLKKAPGYFSDSNLTKKATLNAIASALDYFANIIVALVITPFMVSGLGEYYYGAWQILMRLVGYISPASGRPTQALKFTLAKEQDSTDYDLKRSYVGSTLQVLAMFLPLMGVIGALLSWFVPDWINAPDEAVWVIRITCAILVLNLIATTIIALPRSVLEGENKGYKRMGLSTFLVLVGGGLTWLVLYFKMGILGVAGAALLFSIIQFLFYMSVVRVYSPWFGLAKPSKNAVREFFKLSWWFMIWNLIMNLMVASDVVVLGLLNSVEIVSSYTLSKYAPETAITVVAMMVFGVLPGLGGIIGSGDLKKAVKIRGEIMLMTWMVTTIIGTGIILWNRTFIGLWVGEIYYVGDLSNLFIVLVVLQFVFIRNDANVIDLTLRLSQKVILGIVSVAVSLGMASIFVYYFGLGVLGVCMGIMVGRAILSIAYPILVGRILHVKFYEQLKSIVRPAIITTILFLAATELEKYLPTGTWKSLNGWVLFALSVAVTVVVLTVFSFYTGLSSEQQRTIFRRLQAFLSRSKV